MSPVARTRADVVAAVRAAFAQKDRDAVLGILDQYGAKDGERERERVQLAIIELAAGDADKLLYYVDVAKKDYRDILAWQETGPLSKEEGEALQARVRAALRRWDREI
jgi:hypothetical protein